VNFEDFRKDIENKLNQITKFELQEFHFEPSSFGNGILVYRVKGRIHKFIFDGREFELTWLISNSHQKYSEANFKEFMKIYELKISEEQLKNGIKL
jgi:hypothetical protein